MQRVNYIILHFGGRSMFWGRGNNNTYIHVLYVYMYCKRSPRSQPQEAKENDTKVPFHRSLNYFMSFPRAVNERICLTLRQVTSCHVISSLPEIPERL
jgi:hypothetical protein